MFQGMFRKCGRPPDSLPIGGYEQPSNEESNQIPVHQLMEAPRQLPLPSVRELDQDAIMQQETIEVSNALVGSSSSQPLRQDDNMLNPQDRRLALKPQQVMSRNQAIPILSQEADTFHVPNLRFSQAQRNEIFSETSSRIYRELCGPEGVVFQQLDETFAKQASVQEVLQSFAGAEIGANQRVHETLQRLSTQMRTLQQENASESEKNTSLDWRMSTD